MNDLREKIAQRIEDRFYMFCKDKTIARHAACDILDLELQSTIEKAEKYNKLFESLVAVEECPSIKWHGRTAHFSDCPYCNGTDKISRLLTEAEKEKVMEYLQLLITDIDCGYWFHSKIKVEVKK